MKKERYFAFFLVNILLKRDVHAANHAAFCALWNYDMYTLTTDDYVRAYKDTVTFAPGADDADGNPTCEMSDSSISDYTPSSRPCDCSDAKGALPTASSGIFF